MFYIGKANVPADRIKNHEYRLNKGLEVFYKRNFQDVPPNEYGHYLSYRRWIKYLYENPKITTGKVEIIQRGIHPISLYYMENRHLNAIINHPDCLNAVFSSPRPDKDDHHFCDVQIQKNELVLFNPISQEGVFASSISKTYTDLKKKMNASLHPMSYRQYKIRIMNREYQDAKPYLTNVERSEWLTRITDFSLGKNQPQN